MMEYENFIFKEKSEIINLLSKSDNSIIPSLLIGAVNGIDDSKWLQDMLFNYLNNEDYWISKTSINLFGDLARIYGDLDKEKILLELNNIKNSELKSVIEETIEDINIFCK